MSALTAAPAAAAVEPIQFIDLKTQQARIRADVERRLKGVLDHGRFIQGPEVDELERTLADYAGAADCVAVSNGTDALVMAMMALDLGPGDAVFVPAFTYNASANAVLLAGAVPVFVDIDLRTFTVDVEDLERRIAAARDAGLRPAVVMPVDLYGAPADYAALNRVARAHGLTILADAAQSFGGEMNGVRVGALARFTATSFYPAKALGGYGDGGAIFVTDPGDAEILRQIRWHGTDDGRKLSIRVGLNGRLDSMQCAILLAKLTIFEEERLRRMEIAARYDDALADLVGVQVMADGARSGYGLYTVATDDRDAFRAVLKESGVPTAIYYETPLHHMPAFASYAPEGGLPGAEASSRRAVSLPMHPYLSDAQVDAVIAAVRAAKG